ncbi:unnamed protein product [Rotaria socialis]|uniref:Fungal lipase-type domain-containing protein n=4 Tax=Rotaria socialis TaxID=392032 RepID=A0A817UVE7_9BILA|nr:unnamed protein product [Rotaria socialis]CAF4381920.1 unnamed protein product [Rotaria socialis]
MAEFAWFDKKDKPIFDSYSGISTCLALSYAVYASDAKACISTLNELKDSMQHGIDQILFSTNCKRQYLIASKPKEKEIYVAFRGTESWKALLSSFQVYVHLNDFKGTFHAGYYQQAKLIPLAPFCYLLNKHQDYKLIFTGHSFGGALAAMVTMNMLGDLRTINFQDRIHCVAFGSPFISNKACSQYINDRLKHNFQFYINHSDIIPYLLTYVYNKSGEFLSKEIKKKCNEWLVVLALSLIGGGIEIGLFSRLARRRGGKRWTTQAECESACLGLSKYLIETCRDHLKEVLPEYFPFGFYYSTACTSPDGGTDKSFFLKALPLEEVCMKENRWSSSEGYAMQDHYINNYVTEIYKNVIQKNSMVAYREHSPVRLVDNCYEFSTSPLFIFVVPKTETWKWKNTCNENEDEKPTHYMWSVVSSKYEDKEEITLRIYGPSVSLTTGLKCENSVYAGKALEPEENGDESVRLFILNLPLKENPDANDYPIRIINHFATVDLTGLIEPKKFTLSAGLVGRKRQIADLTVLELYKLAFAYCTFTGDNGSIHSESQDVNRRECVKKYLLLSEKILEQNCMILEKDHLKRLTPEQLRELSKEISYAKNDGQTSRTSPTVSPYASDDELDQISGCFGFRYQSKAQRNDTSTEKAQFQNISTVMKNWFENKSNRQCQASETIDSRNFVLSSTEAVVQVIPRLFCMNIALTRDFELQFDVREIRWKLIGVATIGGCVLGLGGGIAIISTLVGGLLGAFSVGAVFGGSVGLYECLKAVQVEYLKILVFIAKSLGVCMEEVRMHQYSLEEKISSIYAKRLKALPSDEHMYDQ